MTGTGKQTDPYIITTVEELYSMLEIGGNGVYFRLGADIDFNGTPYAENFSVIPIKCREFDGNGHCIRNIYINSTSTVSIFRPYSNSDGTNTAIKNLRLENISLVGSSVNIFKSSPNSAMLDLTGCTFLINFTNITSSIKSSEIGNLMNDNYAMLNFDLCTISVKGTSNYPFPVISYSNFKRSHLCIDIDIRHGMSSYSQSIAIFNSSTLVDSYLTGSIRYHDEGNANYMQIANSLSTAQNFYMAIELAGRSEFYCDMETKTDCFFDSELIGGAVHKIYNSTKCDKFHALTTAQCKDADYLNSIGFICAGDSP